jgi:hypothetical protein
VVGMRVDDAIFIFYFIVLKSFKKYFKSIESTLGAKGKKKQRKKKYEHFIQQLFGEGGFSFTKKN